MATQPENTAVQQAEAELARLKSFLATAPDDLKGWAGEQVAAAEQALEQARSDELDRARAAEDAREAKLLGLDSDDLDAPAPRLRSTGAKAARPAGKRPWWLLPLLAIVAAGIVLAVFIYGDKSQQMPDDHPATAGANATPEAEPSVDVQLLAALEAKVEKDPADVDSWRPLGQMYDKLRAHDKAIGAQQAIIKVVPDDVNAHLALGVAQYSKKDIKGAEKSWQKALELDPKSSQAYYNLGFLYLGNEQVDKAREAWTKLIELEPKSTLAEGVKPHLEQLGAGAAPSATPSK